MRITHVFRLSVVLLLVGCGGRELAATDRRAAPSDASEGALEECFPALVDCEDSGRCHQGEVCVPVVQRCTPCSLCLLPEAAVGMCDPFGVACHAVERLYDCDPGEGGVMLDGGE